MTIDRGLGHQSCIHCYYCLNPKMDIFLFVAVPHFPTVVVLIIDDSLVYVSCPPVHPTKTGLRCHDLH